MGSQKETVSRKGKAVKSKNAAPKGKNPEKKDQGHDFTCVSLSVSTIFHKCLNADEEKMMIVQEIGFGAFKHLPLYYLKHQVLKQIFLRFEPYDHTIHAIAGDVEIATEKIGKALGLKYIGITSFMLPYKIASFFPMGIRFMLISVSLSVLNSLRFLLPFVGSTYPERVVIKDLNDDDYAVFKYFQGISQAALKKLIFSTPVDTNKNRDLFKRAFLLYIQKCFLLPTSAANIYPRALLTIFNLKNTRHQNWALHIYNFLLEEVQKAKDNNTASYRTGKTLWERMVQEKTMRAGLVRTAKAPLTKKGKHKKNTRNGSSSESEYISSDSIYEEGYDSDSEMTMSEALVRVERKNKRKNDSVPAPVPVQRVHDPYSK
ncbi:hypothetical protein PIB30_052259 [Stylosanthes scabra]|uniref:Uncharacterized protein n=1 Tax=Stylosanthes scabra TaxID=79078 RepID=A0ABU6VGK8_9FABA|nr:hypothetical protein [Stylosanthes scabra]